jgi:hypothetical protein
MGLGSQIANTWSDMNRETIIDEMISPPCGLETAGSPSQDDGDGSGQSPGEKKPQLQAEYMR